MMVDSRKLRVSARLLRLADRADLELLQHVVPSQRFIERQGVVGARFRIALRMIEPLERRAPRVNQQLHFRVVHEALEGDKNVATTRGVGKRDVDVREQHDARQLAFVDQLREQERRSRD